MNSHPLADYHFGRPRAHMIHMYFGGHHYLGLHGERLRVVFRPTEVAPNGASTAPVHMSITQKPTAASERERRARAAAA